MRLRIAAARLLVSLIVIGFALTAAHVAGQQAPAPGPLQFTTSSPQAAALFREAWIENQNVAAARAQQRIAEAVNADPQFALARVYQAFLGSGTAAARAQAVADVIPAMKSASVPELLLAVMWREQAAGRTQAALPVLRALSDYAPGDPEIAWMYVNTLSSGKPLTERAALIRDHTKKFPSHAGSRNILAYVLYTAGDNAGALRAAEEYVKLLPKHPNSHDTMADILILLHRPSEALPHVQHAVQFNPDGATGLQKLGAIAMMMGDPVKARAEFARGFELAPTPAQKLAFMHWTAATHALAGDYKSTSAELSKTLAFAELQSLPAETRIAHERMAIVEAYLGDSKSVPGHLTAAGRGTPPLAHYAVKVIANTRIGNLVDARKAAEDFRTAAPANNTVHYTLRALIALKAEDIATAEKELSGSGPSDLMAKAVRADLLLRKGQKTQAEALRRDVAASSVKLDGSGPVDSIKLAARLHAASR